MVTYASGIHIVIQGKTEIFKRKQLARQLNTLYPVKSIPGLPRRGYVPRISRDEKSKEEKIKEDY